MALCRKVDKIINIVLCKQPVDEFPVTDVTFHKHTTFTVYVLFDGAKISGICERIENDYLDIFVCILSVKQVLDVVSADEAGSSGY